MNLSQMLSALPDRRKRGLSNKNGLMTVWGEEILEKSRDNEDYVPLQEYPRPQLVRKNFEGQSMILNGWWKYAIAEDRKLPEEFEGRILVPFSPETTLSGVLKQLTPEQFLWYEKNFSVKRKEGMRALLHFGAVDQICEVFLNGKRIARHIGGYQSFFIEVTESLRDGNNVLRLCVQDTTDTKYLTRGKQKLKSGGIYYTAQSGIWQTVWMEWVPATYIQELKITPACEDRRIDICMILNGENPGGKKGNLSTVKETVYVKAFEPVNGLLCSGEDASDYCDSRKSCHSLTHEVECITIDKKHRECHLLFEISDVKKWTPQTPYLYGIGITVGEDHIETYAALREVGLTRNEMGNPMISLNGQQYFMDGVLDQGYYPESLMTPVSEDAMLNDILTVKKLGFNMIRKHCKIEPDRWYFHCDRLGILVWQDIVNGGNSYSSLSLTYLPNLWPDFFGRQDDTEKRILRKAGRLSAESRKMWRREMEESIHHLYNHPSIVCWVLFNEGWGQFESAKAFEAAKELDPGRLIDAVSGWFDQRAGHLRSVHNYFRPLTVETEKERAFVLSEYGGYAYGEAGHTYSKKTYGYGVYKSRLELNRAFRKQHEKVLSLVEKGLSAAIYTQISDIEEEINGIMTYDRRVVKISSRKDKDAGQPAK